MDGKYDRAAEDLGNMVALEHVNGTVPDRQLATLRFRETDRAVPEYDGHHVQIYVADFSGPHSKLKEKGLVFEESDQYQYRFREIVDPATGAPLITIEHEVRSKRHPLYIRPLVNRNPAQNNINYIPGYDAWV